MRDIFFFIILLIAIGYSFRIPHNCVFLMTWLSLLKPNVLLFGFAQSIRYNVLATGLAIFSIFISKEKINYKPNTTFWLFLLLFLWGTISTLAAEHNHPRLWVHWSDTIKIGVILYLTNILIRSRVRIEGLFLTIIMVYAFWGTYNSVAYVFSGGRHLVTVPSGDNNIFATMLLLTLPLCLYFIKTWNIKFLKLFFFGILIVLIVSTIATNSRGALIGLLFIASTLLMTKGHRGLIIILIILAVSFLLTVAPESWFERMDTISEAKEDSSFLGRLNAWKISFAIAMDNPIFGGGYYAVQDYTLWSSYAFKIDFLDFIETPPVGLEYAKAAHSFVFQVIGDLGFIGFFVYLLIPIYSWFCSGNIISLARKYEELNWAKEMARTIRFSAIAFYITSLALSTAYYEAIFLLAILLPNLKSLTEAEIDKITQTNSPAASPLT